MHTESTKKLNWDMSQSCEKKTLKHQSQNQKKKKVRGELNVKHHGIKCRRPRVCKFFVQFGRKYLT